MKLKYVLEQVTSSAVATNVIPGGFLSMMRRPQFRDSNYLIAFKKEKKKDKEKTKGVIYFAKAKKPGYMYENNETKIKDWIKSNVSKEGAMEELDTMIRNCGYDYEEYQSAGTDEAERGAIGIIMMDAEDETKIKMNRDEKYNIRLWLKERYKFLS